MLRHRPLVVESTTFYGAVAKGGAAATLLAANEADPAVDDYTLIYDLDEAPARQLAEQWPSLPDAVQVSSAEGERLLSPSKTILTLQLSLRHPLQLLEVCVDSLDHRIERELLRDEPVQGLLPVRPDRLHIVLGDPLRQIKLHIVSACFLP